MQQLNHPRIPSYLTTFETSHGFGLVQEYKDAPSLAVERQFTPKQVKKIAISILEILVYLQQRKPQIIHRDIKPENILVDKKFNAYLVDFGFARIHNNEIALSSVASGTPGFIPPEEYFGRDLTEASDLYSLGVTLICLLSGTRSVDVGKLINDEYRFDFKCLPSGIDPQFVRWLRKMVEPNIKNRFANAAVALEALKPIPILLKSNTKSKSKSIEGSIFGQTFAVPLLILIAIAGTQSIQKTSVYQQRVIERQRRTIDHLLYKKEHLEDKIDRINRLQELLMKREQAILLDKLKTTKECNFCNFQNANLANTQLQGISLKKGNLQHSNLVNANFKGSNLSDVNLLGARLSSAILTDANLSNANLDNADLNNADLRGADLRGAKFYFTQLDGADLRGANLRYTNLNGVNLNNVKLTGAIMPDGSTHK